MNEKYLIINADDYGMSHATNEAVEDAFENGVVTSTTLMTTCPWAEEALRRAKANPKMNVGLHTTLTSEWKEYKWGPVSRKTAVPSLTGSDGYFYRSVGEVVSTAKEEEVAIELNAQLDWMLSRGYTPTHVDNHMGSVYGLIGGRSFLNVVFAMCAPRGFAFRLPRQEPYPNMTGEQKALLAQAVAGADSLGVGLLDSLLTNPFEMSEGDSYEGLKAFYMQLVKTIGTGITEIYMHPAVESEEIKAISPDWQKRVWEHRLLKDPDLRSAIEDNGIKLISWKDAPFKQRAMEESNTASQSKP